MHRAAARGTRMVRTDGADSILIDFCSFTRGRVTGATPYFTASARASATYAHRVTLTPVTAHIVPTAWQVKFMHDHVR